MHNKGKTTLLKHLRAFGRYQDSLFSNLRIRTIPKEDTSIGVKIGTWTCYKERSDSAGQHREILFYTWDYAGEVYSYDNICCYFCSLTTQEEYYSSHKLFLHSRTLYLLVWNMWDGEDGVYGLLPWLQEIYVCCNNYTFVTFYFL